MNVEHVPKLHRGRLMALVRVLFPHNTPLNQSEALFAKIIIASKVVVVGVRLLFPILVHFLLCVCVGMCVFCCSGCLVVVCGQFLLVEKV